MVQSKRQNVSLFSRESLGMLRTMELSFNSASIYDYMFAVWLLAGPKKQVIIPTNEQKIAETSNRFVSKVIPTKTFTFQEKITFLNVVN